MKGLIGWVTIGLLLLGGLKEVQGAKVLVGTESVHQSESLVTVEFGIEKSIEGINREFLSNLAMHVVARNELTGDVLPVVPFGNEFVGGIFDAENVTNHINPTELGVLFVNDFVGYPWNTFLEDGRVEYLGSISFLVDGAPVGTYTVTPAWDGQLSAVATSGHVPTGAITWFSVPMEFETGRIVVHTPEPSTMALVLSCLLFLSLKRKEANKHKE